MSDKVIVLYEGRITGVLEGESLNEENIMRSAVGIGKV
jgi:ABC-type sugar transport system ATPase subunit